MGAAEIIDERGPYFGVSLDEQAAECRKWLDDNNRPDCHPAVRHHTIGPPKEGSFEILARVWVNRHWSDTSKIHCNLCNTIRKFVSGGYVAAYDDGWWYVVGPNCGGEEFFGRFTTALHRYTRTEAERQAEGGLRHLLTQLGAWQAFHISVRDAALCAEHAAQVLESYEPSLFAEIQEARRADGQLYIVTPVRALDRNQKPYTRYDRDGFATLAGTRGVSRPCIPAAYVKRIAGDVLGFLSGDKSLLDAITAHIERNEVTTLQKRVEEGLDNLKRAHDGVLEAQQFWAASNLDWLSAWIGDRRNPFPRKLALSSKGDLVKVTLEADPDYSLTIDVGTLRRYAAAPPIAQ